MSPQVVVLLQRPEQIPQGLAMARQLDRGPRRPQVVFLCPGCASHMACRSRAAAVGDLDPPCLTDRTDTCAPPGFSAAEESRIARMIREADIVVPV